MNADIHTLFESDFYRILNFKCLCADCKTSKPEYSEAFSISFVRKGNFLFNVFRQSLDSYTGCVLITKPGYERTVTHIHTVADECTIFEFTPEFYEKLLEQFGDKTFLFNKDKHATLIETSPGTEFLHFKILSLVIEKTAGKLEIDNLVIDIIGSIFLGSMDYQPNFQLNPKLKTNHLVTIEKAKSYLVENFANDISLTAIAANCNVSAFHFSRIFKRFTSFPPHQYLLNIRLKNAELLLKNTAMKVENIAFASGFNSIEHFTTTFRLRHKSPPSSYKPKKNTGF